MAVRTHYRELAQEIVADAARDRAERHRTMARQSLADAREALVRNGFTPAEPDAQGATIYRPDPTVPPVTHSAFVTLTLASAATARAIRVNPRHVMHVALYRGHVGAETTQITFTDGSAQLVTESVEDVVAQLEAALEAVAA